MHAAGYFDGLPGRGAGFEAASGFEQPGSCNRARAASISLGYVISSATGLYPAHR